MKKERTTGTDGQAMRLMEALSGVDEELLERSSKRKISTGIRYYTGRYSAACIACLCLLITGTAVYCMQSGGKSSGESPENRMADRQEAARNPYLTEGYAADDALPEVAAEDADTIVMEAEEAEVTGGAEEALAETPGRSESGCPEEAVSGKETETQKNSDAETAPDARTEALLAKLSEPGGIRLPEGYQLLSADSVEQIYCWTDGTHELRLKLTQTDASQDLRVDAEPPVYAAEENWRELLPKNAAREESRLALLYEDGLLVEYSGCLTGEELAELLESLR